MSAAHWALLIVLVLPAGFLAAAIGLSLLWVGERVHRWWRDTDTSRIEADAAEREEYRARVAALTDGDVEWLRGHGWPDAHVLNRFVMPKSIRDQIELVGGPMDGEVVEVTAPNVMRFPLPYRVEYGSGGAPGVGRYERDPLSGQWRYAGLDQW